MRSFRRRSVLLVLASLLVTGACTSAAIDPAPRADGGIIESVKPGDSGSDTTIDDATVDALDGSQPRDAGADAFAFPDVGPPLDASEPDGAASTIACTYQSKQTGLPGCAGCVLPAEETLTKEKIGIVFGPVGGHCESDAGPGIRSIGLPITALVKKIHNDLESRYQLTGAPPSEVYESKDSVGCGPIPNGSFLGKITVEDGGVAVSLDYQRQPTIAGCAAPNGCVKNTLLCSGTMPLP